MEFLTRFLLMLGGSESCLEKSDSVAQLMCAAATAVWNIPLIVVLCGTGILLTILLKGVQFKAFRHAIDIVRGKFDDPNDPGEISHFQALTTALSATVGLGNIGGVAIAIKLGGPGATFWMIVVGLLGMITKYAECTLALKYRSIDSSGRVHGGPMYYIEKGLGSKAKPLAILFAFFALVASFGAGNMFQSNQVAEILQTNFSIPEFITGLTLAVFTAIVIIGGIKRIGNVTSKLVPFMGAIYILGAIIVILANITHVPSLIAMIFSDAFTGTAAAGGFAGATFRQVFVQGVRRACFSNEAGLGSAPIAHSAASTKEPVREGVVALLEPFIDTVVICTMTAIVILISGAWTSELTGVSLTAAAFNSGIPGFGQYFVPLAITLFAYSTLLSWSYYGEQATNYLFGHKALLIYKILFCGFVFLGAVRGLGTVLDFSDAMLGLMVVPNLIGVWFLFPKLREETQNYFKKLERGEFTQYK